jgi:hypothetical protein
MLEDVDGLSPANYVGLISSDCAARRVVGALFPRGTPTRDYLSYYAFRTPASIRQHERKLALANYTPAARRPPD